MFTGCRHLILVKALETFVVKVILFGEGALWPVLQFSTLTEGWQQNTAFVQGIVLLMLLNWYWTSPAKTSRFTF